MLTFLGGKEFVFDNKQGKTRILGVNGRISILGGHRIVPVDEDLSYQQQEIYYDWTNPYQEQNPTDIFLDITISYRTNKKNHSSIWTFQIKNLTGSDSNYMYQYNLKEDKIEYTSLTVVVPELSYKIEF